MHILQTFVAKKLYLRTFVKKMQHLRTFVEKQILDFVPNGTKVSIWSQKSPDFVYKSQIFQVSSFFLNFPRFSRVFSVFSVVFRFSKVLHKSSRLHRGTNMTRNSGLEKVPILLTSPKFLSFPRFCFQVFSLFLGCFQFQSTAF